MALLDFGGNPVRVTSTGAAPAAEVLDVGLYYANMTLLLNVYPFEAPGGSPSFTLKLETSMDLKNWVDLGTFTAVTAPITLEKKNFTELLRYVRWYVTVANMTSATFVLSGVARNS